MTRPGLPPLRILLLLGAVGCRERPLDPGTGACATGDCVRACVEDTVRCQSASRLAVCRDGAWIESTCDVACADNRCIECLEDDRRCRDENTAEVCRSGWYESEPCGSASCVGGHCLCTEDELRCASDTERAVCGEDGLRSNVACPAERPHCSDGVCGQCIPGTSVCDDAWTARVCSYAGQWERHPCSRGCDTASGQCDGCTPGERRCAHGSRLTVEACEEGARFAPVQTCDAEAGAVCSEGNCLSLCDVASDVLAPSGCAFHSPPVLALRAQTQPGFNDVGPSTQLHLVNPDRSFYARVSVQTATGVRQVSVPPLRTHVVLLDGRTVSPVESHRLAGEAVVITSNRPLYVVVYIDANVGGESPKSGDTAFLLPDHLLSSYGKRYRVLTQPVCTPHEPLPGGFSLVSLSSEPTQVRMDLRAPTQPGAAGDPPAFPAGPTSYTLQPLDVVHFRTGCTGSPGCPGGMLDPAHAYDDGNDLTGSLITTDDPATPTPDDGPPVGVFNGGVSRVPCDGGHIQTQLLEQLMPVGLWGGGSGDPQGFAAVARNIPKSDGTTAGNERWVFVTDEAPNQLSFDFASQTLAQPGDQWAFHTAGGGPRSFRLLSEHPVLIARYYYTTSNAAGGSTFTLERPIRFWRSDYHFAAVGSERNRIQIVVPAGAAVILDDLVLVEPRSAAPGGHEVLETSVDLGPHRVRSDQRFSLFVYGHGLDGPLETGSYSYMGPVGFDDAVP